ncbi:hypothetical protein ACH4S8_25035 [Streptomyces sp. NPDC021080]|uniref:hypothetical protein n=1 Tax=Streptomyces sp. NPDC021080 TaxID=3365110 RepID=UPI0037A36B15
MMKRVLTVLVLVGVAAALVTGPAAAADNGDLGADVTTLLDSSRHNDGSDHTTVNLNPQNALSGRSGREHAFLKVDGGDLIGGYHSADYTGNDIAAYYSPAS